MIKKFLQKIFKTVTYNIFFQIYGRVEKSISCEEDKRIKVEIINLNKNFQYRIYKITSGRLYTDRIQDTAVLIDNKIIKEPSFQLRKKENYGIHNSNIKDNIVFRIGTPRKLRTINGSVLSLLTGGAGNNNYWHWLFDVLPRLAICNKFYSLDKIDFFLLPDSTKRFQYETLDALNISIKQRLSSAKFRHIKTQKLIITDHPVVTSGNPTKDIMNIPEWIPLWLRDKFLKRFVSKNIKNIKNIYIDRNDNSSKLKPQRFIANEDEVKNILIKNNFTSIKLHELKFSEQVNLFYNAEKIIGLHGGGFANLIFCKPGTKVLEFKSLNSGAPIENLAKRNNLEYNSIIANTQQIEKFNNPNQQGSYYIPAKILSKKLES